MATPSEIQHTGIHGNLAVEMKVPTMTFEEWRASRGISDDVDEKFLLELMCSLNGPDWDETYIRKLLRGTQAGTNGRSWVHVDWKMVLARMTESTLEWEEHAAVIAPFFKHVAVTSSETNRLHKAYELFSCIFSHRQQKKLTFEHFKLYIMQGPGPRKRMLVEQWMVACSEKGCWKHVEE